MMVGFSVRVLVAPSGMPESRIEERSGRFMEEPASMAAMSTALFAALGKFADPRCGDRPAELLEIGAWSKSCGFARLSGSKTGAGVT